MRSLETQISQYMLTAAKGLAPANVVGMVVSDAPASFLRPKPDPEGNPWVEVDIAQGPTNSSITVDLSKLNGSQPVAISYAW